MAPEIWLHTVGGGLLSNIPVIFTRSGLEVLGEVMNSYDKKKRAICKFFFFFFLVNYMELLIKSRKNWSQDHQPLYSFFS